MSDDLLYDLADHVATITINRRSGQITIRGLDPYGFRGTRWIIYRSGASASISKHPEKVDAPVVGDRGIANQAIKGPTKYGLNFW